MDPEQEARRELAAVLMQQADWCDTAASREPDAKDRGRSRRFEFRRLADTLREVAEQLSRSTPVELLRSRGGL